MKYFIMLIIASLVSAFPFNLNLIEENEVPFYDDIRGMDVYGYHLYAFVKHGEYVELIDYQIDPWEQVSAYGWIPIQSLSVCFEPLGSFALQRNDEDSEFIWSNGHPPQANPAINGWGLAYLNLITWETDGSDGLWYMEWYGDTILVSTPEITTQMYDLSDYSDDMLLAITADQRIHAWTVSGSSLTYEGSNTIPVDAMSITGVAWDPLYPETLFIGYKVGGSWYIGKFSISPSALEQTTWGSIKSSF